MFRQAIATSLLVGNLAAGGAALALGCDAGIYELQEALPGKWKVENTAGVLTMQGRTIPLPPGNSSTATIAMTETGLTLSGGGAPGTYPLEIVDDAFIVLDKPTKSFREVGGAFIDGNAGVLSELEVTVLAGCADDEVLPRLAASGTYQDAEGPVEFDLFLFVVSEDLLYGVVAGELKSMGGKARRITTWSR